jgi:hypothetical protein
MTKMLTIALLCITMLHLGMSVTVDVDTATSFVDWMRKYNRVYESPQEAFRRYGIFRDNLDRFDAHLMQSDATYTIGVGPFTDLTFEEFADHMGLLPLDNSSFVQIETDVPAADIDWRDRNAVTHPKNQGSCGSCWAFSAIGAMEGAHAIKTSSLVDLSEQQLVECSGGEGNEGCNGGLMDNAFHWIIKNGGVALEADYPYTGKDTATCKTDAKIVANTAVDSITNVARGDENGLATAVGGRPVSVAVAANENWQHYTGGVFNDPWCWLTQLNHGVLAIGIKGDAWIIKNSWGATWGEQGFMLLKKGDNMCGVAEACSYPVLE